MTAEDTALKMLGALTGAYYWPLTEETAREARRLVEAGNLAVVNAEANQGRGVYRLNAPEPVDDGG